MKDIILVNENDKELGVAEKIYAHQKGLLHRAFSIFIFNSKNELLLQQRAFGKYHSGGLWSNTCCSHPKPGEKIIVAAHRRLKEEMGFDCKIEEQFSFLYEAKLDMLSEHEFDHVLIGFHDNDPKINPAEVSDFKWMTIIELQKDIRKNSDKYTYWFKIAFPKAADLLSKIEYKI